MEYVSPVTGRVTATNTGTMLLVRGPVDTTIAERCSRCLDGRPYPDPRGDGGGLRAEGGGRPGPPRQVHQVVEEDRNRARLRGQGAQLGVLIRQAALLAAPLQPLCREACPGIPVQPSPDHEEDEFQNLPFRDLSRYLNDQDADQ